MEAQVSQNVIATDRRLDKATERSTEELAAHRWHWTLDESNPKRVSIRAYGRAVGRAEQTIRYMVNGYADWTAQSGLRTLSECIQRAMVSADKAAAIDAVAKATGNTFKNTRERHSDTVSTVRAVAEQRAERNRTTVAEEIPGAAEAIVKGQRADANERKRRKAEHTLEYISIEGDVSYAMRKLRHALDTAQDCAFDGEERELLEHSLETLRSVLHLIDLAVTGSTKVDWDAELAKLDGAA